MTEDIAKNPTPAAKRLNWRRDRGEKKADSDSEVVEACGARVDWGSAMVDWRKAI